MAKTIEERLKENNKILRALLIKQSLYDEVFEHILSSLKSIKIAETNTEQRLEQQSKTLAEQTAVHKWYNKQKTINQQLREELTPHNANDGAVARLLDRSDELVKQLDDLYADAPPTTGGDTPTGEQPVKEQPRLQSNPGAAMPAILTTVDL